MSTNCQDRSYPQSIWEEIKKMLNRYNTTMKLSDCEHNDEDENEDYEEHDTTT